jgi:hypothetical protein
MKVIYSLDEWVLKIENFNKINVEYTLAKYLFYLFGFIKKDYCKKNNIHYRNMFYNKKYNM